MSVLLVAASDELIEKPVFNAIMKGEEIENISKLGNYGILIWYTFNYLHRLLKLKLIEIG